MSVYCGILDEVFIRWLVTTIFLLQILGGNYEANFPRFVILPNFQHHENTRYLFNITFIFDRCHRSWVAMTPVKHECDVKKWTGTFARSKIQLAENLTNGALVTPTPAFFDSSSNFISRRIQYDTFHTHNISTISQMYSSGGCQRSSVAHRADNIELIMALCRISTKDMCQSNT